MQLKGQPSGGVEPEGHEDAIFTAETPTFNNVTCKSLPLWAGWTGRASFEIACFEATRAQGIVIVLVVRRDYSSKGSVGGRRIQSVTTNVDGGYRCRSFQENRLTTSLSTMVERWCVPWVCHPSVILKPVSEHTIDDLWQIPFPNRQTKQNTPDRIHLMVMNASDSNFVNRLESF
jgi:hypothetical protein